MRREARRPKNEFGKYMAKLMIDHELSYVLLGEKIGVNGVYLSQLGVGTKNISDHVVRCLINSFNLNFEQQLELWDIVDRTRGRIDINLDNLTEKEQEELLKLSGFIRSKHLENKVKSVVYVYNDH